MGGFLPQICFCHATCINLVVVTSLFSVMASVDVTVKCYTVVVRSVYTPAGEHRILFAKLQKEFPCFVASTSPRCVSIVPRLEPSLPTHVVLTTDPVFLDSSHVTYCVAEGNECVNTLQACGKHCLSNGVMVVIIPTECLSLGSQVSHFHFFFLLGKKNLFGVESCQ